MTKTLKGLEFDPGFGPYIMAFQGTVEYVYNDINRFKNLSQKKVKFMQYYKKILEVFYNNIGFYTGCLMWASYIKEQPKQKILSNNFLGRDYVETENTADVDYLIQFAELFPKDMKYFLGQNFSFEPEVIQLLNLYKEFLVENKGFTSAEYNTDVVLPKSIKPYSDDYKKNIDESISEGNLGLLKDKIKTIL